MIFAYGSNMHLADLNRWLQEQGGGVVGQFGVKVGRLLNYRLAWNYYSVSRGGGAANVVYAPRDQVWGILLPSDQGLLELIDQKEGHPVRYSRGDTPLLIHARAASSTTQAWVYRVTPEYERNEPCLPTQAYLDLVRESALHWGFDSNYVKRLNHQQTCD
ncbi:MAG: gamma-glutamylcyclotransferase family protein [Bradymonadia bacterium]